MLDFLKYVMEMLGHLVSSGILALAFLVISIAFAFILRLIRNTKSFRAIEFFENGTVVMFVLSIGFGALALLLLIIKGYK